MKLRATVVALGLGAITLPAPAVAHERTVSYSSWELQARRATVRVRLSLRDASRIEELIGALAAYLPGALSLHAGALPCVPDLASVSALPTEPAWVVYTWRIECPPGDAERRIHSEVLLDLAPSHLHFVRVGTTGVERVLSDRDRDWVLTGGTGAGAGASLADYVALGVGHIVTGYDHLVFLLALLVLATTLGEAARVVTGFTLGHSLTLGLTVLGQVTPAAGAVEALIGLSIALVAIENVWLAGGRVDGRLPRWTVLTLVATTGLALGWGRVAPETVAGLALFTACYFGLLARARRPASLRWLVATLFGLVHGFGFAGVLAEMALTRERLVPALFGFNLGVELGQLAIIAIAWPALYAIARRGERWRLRLVEYGSAGVLAVGVFWFIGRTFG